MSVKTMFYAVHTCNGLVGKEANIEKAKCPFWDSENEYCSIMERFDDGYDLPEDCILRTGDILVFIAREEKK